MENKKEQFELIVDFLNKNSSLEMDFVEEGKLKLTQTVDGKSLEIDSLGVEDVLEREDSSGKPFLQVNFLTGSKILLTKSLVGFKPALFDGVDPKRIPNVVTTPDLLSIVEAMSEFDKEEDYSEYRALRRMYYSILHGAEAVGFEITNEKLWVAQMNSGSAAA